MSQLYYVVIEHIKLGRDMDDKGADCDCGCVKIDQAYDCDCECHIEIREQQTILVKSEHNPNDTRYDLGGKADKFCNLTIQGDVDIIDSGIYVNKSCIMPNEGILETVSDTYKSYD